MEAVIAENLSKDTSLDLLELLNHVVETVMRAGSLRSDSDDKILCSLKVHWSL